MVGEHIRALKGGRWIHAIDCGDETVLHLADDVTPPRVRRAYRPEFVAGAAAVESVTHRERTFPPKEVVRRAYSRAADPALAAMFRDSEAFAEWCETGRFTAGPPNVALEVPGVAPAEWGPAPAARPNGATRAQRPAPRPPKLQARAAARTKPARAKAKPAVKAKAKAKASGTARRAAPKAKPARKPARKTVARRRAARR